MEQFDQKSVGRKRDMQAKLKESTMVKESKSRQRNAWGSGNSVSAKHTETYRAVHRSFFLRNTD